MSLDKFKNISNDPTEKRGFRKKSYSIVPDENDKVSFRFLRRFIGFLGLFLPIVLMVATMAKSTEILPSISDYFYTAMGPYFVGILMVIGCFFIAQHHNRIEEKILNITCGILALLIALFPTYVLDGKEIKEGVLYSLSDFKSLLIPSIPYPKFVGVCHYIAAILFFLCLIAMVLVFFLRGERRSPEPSKGKIITYKICGWGMLIAIASVPIVHLLDFKGTWFDPAGVFPIVFVAEMVALWLFGLAWLARGDAQEIFGEHGLQELT